MLSYLTWDLLSKNRFWMWKNPHVGSFLLMRQQTLLIENCLCWALDIYAQKMVHVIKEDPFALLDLISKLRQLGKVSETVEIRLSGENISWVILSAINSADLPLHLLVGQCYDGAACMRCMNIGVHLEKIRERPVRVFPRNHKKIS